MRTTIYPVVSITGPRAGGSTCRVEGCRTRARTRDLCGMHYERLRTHGDIHHRELVDNRSRLCSRDGCENRAIAKLLCSRHYFQQHAANKPPCSIPECENKSHSRGLCTRHYMQVLQEDKENCSIPGCESKIRTKELCRKHYMQNYRRQRRIQRTA